MPVNVRAFRRSDRDQLAALVNQHVSAVLPGINLSTNVVLSQLEREPDDLIIDPWVVERPCLVAECDQAIVAAALIHRFGLGAEVNDNYRGAAELRWCLFIPGQQEAANALITAAVALMRDWEPTHVYADCTLPAPACVGVSSAWPHIHDLFVAHGFTGPARQDVALVVDCQRLTGLETGGETQRSVGALGTRLDLIRDDRPVGYIELSVADLQRSSAATTWADIGNLVVADGHNRADVMASLLGAAARWLELGGIDRLIDYSATDVHPPEYLAVLTSLGFTELTTNSRGWELR